MFPSRRHVLGLLASAWLLPGPVLAGTRLRLAVLPYLPAQELQKRLGPLLIWLGEALTVEIDLVVAPTYDAMIAMVGSDEVDLAYIGPAPYVRMIRAYGAKRLLGRLETTGSAEFRGAIVVRADSPLQRLSDLRGKHFAFGDHQSTMSHLIPHHMMLQAGVRLRDLAGHAFLGSHNNVALGVLSGEFDAGAVKDEVFLHYRVRGLRAIAMTIPVSEQVFLATARLPKPLAEGFAVALGQAWNDAEGRQALAAITPGVSGFVAVADADFDGLRVVLDQLDAAADE